MMLSVPVYITFVSSELCDLRRSSAQGSGLLGLPTSITLLIPGPTVSISSSCQPSWASFLPEFLWAVRHHSYSANEEVWLTFNSPINTQSYFSSKWASRLFSGLCYSLEILESAFGVHQQHPDEIFKLELPWIDFRRTEISTILLPAIMKMILSFWLNLL